MATITPTTPAAGGSTLATQAPTGTGANADKYRNSGKESLVIINGGGAPITVTRTARKACDQGTLHDNVVSVAAGATEYLPPVSPLIFNDDDGFVGVTVSSTTSVTFGVLSTT